MNSAMRSGNSMAHTDTYPSNPNKPADANKEFSEQKSKIKNSLKKKQISNFIKLSPLHKTQPKCLTEIMTPKNTPSPPEH